jgi:hypothetical protein
MFQVRAPASIGLLAVTALEAIASALLAGG